MVDDTDLKIIRHVSVDADLSYEEIAERVGTSRSTVYRRVKSMVERGVLPDAPTKLPNYDELGYKALVFDIRVDITDVERAMRVVGRDEGVTLLFRMYGDYDLHGVMLCPGGGRPDCADRLRKRLSEEGVEVKDLRFREVSGWEKLDFAPPPGE